MFDSDRLKYRVSLGLSSMEIWTRLGALQEASQHYKATIDLGPHLNSR
jgi:hypothetical protein